MKIFQNLNKAIYIKTTVWREIPYPGDRKKLKLHLKIRENGKKKILIT